MVSYALKMKPVSLYFLYTMNCSFLQKSKPNLCWEHLADSQLHHADLLWTETFCYFFGPTHKPSSRDQSLLRFLSIIRPPRGWFDTFMCLGPVWCTSYQQFYVIYTNIIHSVLTIMTSITCHKHSHCYSNNKFVMDNNIFTVIALVESIILFYICCYITDFTTSNCLPATTNCWSY